MILFTGQSSGARRKALRGRASQLDGAPGGSHLTRATEQLHQHLLDQQPGRVLPLEAAKRAR
jgi:hypothetical protein